MNTYLARITSLVAIDKTSITCSCFRVYIVLLEIYKKKFRLTLDKIARDSHVLPFRVNAEVANGPCLAVLLITTGEVFMTRNLHSLCQILSINVYLVELERRRANYSAGV